MIIHQRILVTKDFPSVPKLPLSMLTTLTNTDRLTPLNHWLNNLMAVVVVVVVYFPNCNRHTAHKYIFRGVQFLVIPSEQYSCDL